ncbi:MAG: hypothetical protein AB7K63_20040 [Vicinamibacterales bacterium]
MRLLFFARHFSYFRNFDAAIAELAGRGHEVFLAADVEESLGGRELVDRLAAGHPGRVAAGYAPAQTSQWRWRPLAAALRHTLDYLRYASPPYDQTPKIRERAYERTPLLAFWAGHLPWRGAVVSLVGWLERAVPRDPAVDRFIADHAPDAVLVTPLIELGSPQIDYVRAARAAGIPTALPVWSWDHLSSKALIREVPDLVLVWNGLQRDEARRFHGIDAGKVAVTGAQCFDRWFDREPERARDEFCRRAGLPDTGPYVLYVCSSLFKNSPSEREFVQRWLRALRASPDPVLRQVSVLVRPHPQRAEEWREQQLDDPRAVVWGSNPIDHEARADYFDSMYHAAAIVGLNTSALVEAAIVDRPVLTILTPEFRDNQEGTFHFQHLLDAEAGCLIAAPSLDDHTRQLAAAIANGHSAANRAFVERFIRPHGRASAATPRFVDAVERLAGTGRAAPSRVRVPLLARPLVGALALAQRAPVLERMFWTPIRRREWAENLAAIRDKRSRRRAKELDRAVRVARQAARHVVVGAKTTAKRALIAGGLRKGAS